MEEAWQINQTAFRASLPAYSYAKINGHTPHRIDFTVEVGVAFTWFSGKKESVIEFYNDGECLCISMGYENPLPPQSVTDQNLQTSLESLWNFATPT